jgi:hypothetical protein
MMDHPREVGIVAQGISARRPRGITCNGCEHTWTGLRFAHCSACHRTFSGVAGFERHRFAGRCIDPAIMRTQAGEPVMRLEAGVWRSFLRDERQR